MNAYNRLCSEMFLDTQKGLREILDYLSWPYGEGVADGLEPQPVNDIVGLIYDELRGTFR